MAEAHDPALAPPGPTTPSDDQHDDDDDVYDPAPPSPTTPAVRGSSSSHASPAQDTGLTSRLAALYVHSVMGNPRPGYRFALNPYYSCSRVRAAMLALGAPYWPPHDLDFSPPYEVSGGGPLPPGTLSEKWHEVPITPSPSPSPNNSRPATPQSSSSSSLSSTASSSDSDSDSDSGSRPPPPPASKKRARDLGDRPTACSQAHSTAQVPTDADPRSSPSLPSASRRRRMRAPTAPAAAVFAAAAPSNHQVAPLGSFPAYGPGFDASVWGEAAYRAAVRARGGAEQGPPTTWADAVGRAFAWLRLEEEGEDPMEGVEGGAGSSGIGLGAEGQ